MVRNIGKVNISIGILEAKRVKGRCTDCIWGKILCNEGTINTTYDCNTHKLVIHEWMLLPEEKVYKLRSELSEIFEKMI